MRALIQVRAPDRRLGAAVDHRVEVNVAHHPVAVLAHRAPEARGHMKGIERQHATPLRLDPVERRVVRALRHGENPAGVRLEQDFGRDLDERGLHGGRQTTDLR